VLVLLPLDVEYTDATPLWLWLLLALVIDGAMLTRTEGNLSQQQTSDVLSIYALHVK
jgi:hypothetical protein